MRVLTLSSFFWQYSCTLNSCLWLNRCCIANLSVESAICSIYWIDVWLTAAHRAESNCAFAKIGLEVFNICIIVGAHFLRFWIQACELVSPSHVGELQDADLFAIVLGICNWHVIEWNESSFIGAFHCLKNCVLSRCFLHAEWGHCFVCSSCRCSPGRLRRVQKVTSEFLIDCDSSFWFFPQIGKLSPQLRIVLHASWCRSDWCFPSMNARWLLRGTLWIDLEAFDPVFSVVCFTQVSWAFVILNDSIGVQVVATLWGVTSRPLCVALGLHEVFDDHGFYSLHWLETCAVVTFAANRSCWDKTSLSFDRLQHVKSILSVDQLCRVPLKIKSTSLKLVGRESHLLGSIGFSLAELGVVLVWAHKLVVGCKTLLQVDFVVSRNGAKWWLQLLNRLTFVYEVFHETLCWLLSIRSPTWNKFAIFVKHLFAILVAILLRWGPLLLFDIFVFILLSLLLKSDCLFFFLLQSHKEVCDICIAAIVPHILSHFIKVVVLALGLFLLLLADVIGQFNCREHLALTSGLD